MTNLPVADRNNRRWLRALLAAVGTTFVSASPIILGKIAGLPSLLTLFPKSLQIVTVATLPFLLGFVSLIVSLVGNTRIKKPRLGLLLTITTIVGSIALISLLAAYLKAVTRIETGDGAIHVFVTGFGDRPSDCCPAITRMISNEECIIREKTFADDAIHTCFGDARIQDAEMILALLYILLFGAVAVGAAVVSWSGNDSSAVPKGQPGAVSSQRKKRSKDLGVA